jgi:hypothetical protein
MKTINIAKYVTTAVGIGLLTGAFFLYQDTTAFLGEAARAEGTVVDLIESRSSDSTTYRPVVNFTATSGRTIGFASSSGSNPPSYDRGDKVDVFYLPADPENARIDGFFSLWGGATILAGLGSAFLIVGAGLMLVPMLKRRRDEYLRQHGTRIETVFQRVELNKALSVNGRHPFRILTQWQNPSTSKVHVFESSNLWYDPTDHIKSDSIAVYIEKNNPKKYVVDLSFLPDLAP